MAEPVAIVGGVASFVQLIGYIIKTSETVAHFCDEVKDAPRSVLRIRTKLNLLREGLQQIQQYLQTFDDAVILPPDLRETLVASIRRIEDDIKDVREACSSANQTTRVSLSRRIKWAAMERSKVQRLLARLESSEAILDRTIHLTILRSSTLTHLSLKRSGDTTNHIYTTLMESRAAAIHGSRQLRGERGARTRYEIPSIPLTTRRRLAVIKADSWLRTLGFYGSLTYIFTNDGSRGVRVVIGFKLPAWMSKISVDMEAEFATISSQAIGLRVLPGEIRLQNRVERSSPFILACSNGDTQLIKQHLKEKTGNLGDRTICTGSTPLMAAIEGQHLEAVRCLLEFGADPNVGDDDQVLPVFAVLGMYPRRNKYFPQLPPSWSSWLEVFKLLVEYGASVHEDVGDRVVSTLNLIRGGPGVNLHYTEPNIVEYFRVLHEQCYVDFNRTSRDGVWSSLLTAIRATTKSMEALRFLSEMGVDFARLSDKGASSLHFAAEMAREVQTLEFLCSTTAIQNINRQDAYGWSPLHFAVASGRYGYHEVAFDKIRCLLQHGIDPTIKARKHPMLFSELSASEFTALELSELSQSDFHGRFEEEVARIRQANLNDNDEDTFFDALSEQVL